MTSKRWGALLLLGAFALSAALGGCSPAQSTTKTGTTPTAATSATLDSALSGLFVTVDQLKADSASVVIIDARADKDYAAGHIPGAINATWQAFATVGQGAAGDPNWGVLKSTDEIAKQLGTLGIDTSKPIVVYADPAGWGEDGRIVWMLRAAGIKDSKMLDGGFPAWKKAGNDSNTEVPKPSATTVSISSIDSGWVATTADVQAASGKTTIIDARSEKEYDGATDFGEKRGGHIPGAKNVPFLSVFKDDGTIKSAADLKAMFDKAGATTDADVVVYCTKGIRSGYETLLLRELGYAKARNYDASFYAWAGDATLKVEK